ncbi:MAG: hypothetical protein HOV81_25525 [Kofleriaceae bacterium]|nr:hypothetical protein [Kofleriaceae bacterium]
MSSVFQKPGRKQWYARIKGAKVPGKWSDVPTNETDRDRAERFAAAAQKAIDKKNNIARPDVLTLKEWVRRWLLKRAEAGHDWKKDRGRLDNHVLPVLGSLELAEVTTALIAELVHDLRFKKKLANRTVRNVYSVLAAAFRDARIAGHVNQTPCILGDEQLGQVVDADPEWRDGALFTRDEVEAMIGDSRIPADRQLVYAFGLLAGLRPGEGAALRWRHYNATREPLGMLTVAKAYSTTRSEEKGTKTNAVKYVPVHPVLAEMLAQWRAIGWPAMFGREPEPDDLIVPLPPDVKRTKRTGERFRGWDYTGRRWREIDLAALGWRSRSVYDTRATFITLALEDGANRDIIRSRITHTPPKRDAFDGYDRGERWTETCREVSKLRIRRLADVLLTKEPTMRDDSLRRRVSNGQTEPPELRVIQGGQEVILSPCDVGLRMLSASLRTADADDSTDEEKAG